MGDTCLPGLQGFPVQVTGWSGFTEKDSIVTPNDIEFQFSPSETPMAFTSGFLNLNANNTFYMAGQQFRVDKVTLSQPKQEGIASFSGTPVAELRFWGVPTGATSFGSQNLAVLILPIFQKPETIYAGTAIGLALTGKAVRLSYLFPQGPGIDVVRYATCVETDKASTVTIQVAYWTNGVGMSSVDVAKLPTARLPGVPVMGDYKLLSNFTQQADGKKTNPVYNVEGAVRGPKNMLQPYTRVAPISVTSTEFSRGFRLIKDFKQRANVTQDADSYKCIPIDRTRDIKDGKLQVDPRNGTRLDQEAVAAQALQDENKVAEAKIGPGEIWLGVCYLFGVVIGFGALAALLVALGTFIFKRASPATVVVAAGALPAATSGAVPSRVSRVFTAAKSAISVVFPSSPSRVAPMPTATP